MVLGQFVAVELEDFLEQATAVTLTGHPSLLCRVERMELAGNRSFWRREHDRL